MDDDTFTADDRLGKAVPMQVDDALKTSGIGLPLFGRATFERPGAVFASD